MSKDKQKYLAAYVPEAKPKETPKRSGVKDSGRMKEIEDAIAEFNDLLKKQNRDNLDAMYNIDMDNMSSSMRRLFQSYDDGISSAQSSIEAWANEMEAGFSAVAEWQKTVEDGTIESIASLKALADENGASIANLVQWRSEMDGEMESVIETTALIQAQVDENSADIELLTQFRASVEDGTISSIASIKEKADANEASIISLTQFQQTVEDGTISSIAAIREKADANEADITLLAQWKTTAQGDIDDLVESVALIDVKADENGASITQIVEAVGEDGEVTAASIAVAISEEESFIQLIADKVNIEGVVTFESLENDGESVINGNNILLKLDGSDDDGGTDLESENGLGFIYQTSGGTERSFADIYTSVDGSDSDETSRYALNIVANRFRNEDGDYVYASLKMEAAGRVSIWGQYGIYLGTYSNEGYISLEAMDCTRIFAPKDYDSLIYDTGESYCFCADGLYYNGKRIVDNSQEV